MGRAEAFALPQRGRRSGPAKLRANASAGAGCSTCWGGWHSSLVLQSIDPLGQGLNLDVHVRFLIPPPFITYGCPRINCALSLLPRWPCYARSIVMLRTQPVSYTHLRAHETRRHL
eukprot:11845538-Prorocentrum_lima.AAC.1